jgi:hypothetical protein
MKVNSKPSFKFVGQEFIPKTDKLASLKQAIAICDI